MTLRTFFQLLEARDDAHVPYLSFQNDSLRAQFQALRCDVPPCIEFAREAFGNAPDAVNLWIGDDRALTTMHQDFYENMCVGAFLPALSVQGRDASGVCWGAWKGTGFVTPNRCCHVCPACNKVFATYLQL